MPAIDPSAILLQGSVVVGDVTLEKDVGVWYNAVLRGDHSSIYVGEGSNVQDNCVIHVSNDCPVHIGKGVSIGHAAIIHGCTIGDNTIVGMGAIVMDNAVVGQNCIIGAGALVTQGKVIPDGSIVLGSPAKVVRQATEDDIASIHQNAEYYVDDIRRAAVHKA